MSWDTLKDQWTVVVLFVGLVLVARPVVIVVDASCDVAAKDSPHDVLIWLHSCREGAEVQGANEVPGRHVHGLDGQESREMPAEPGSLNGGKPARVDRVSVGLACDVPHHVEVQPDLPGAEDHDIFRQMVIEGVGKMLDGDGVGGIEYAHLPARVDAEKGEGRKLSSRYAVTSFPTLLFLDEKVERWAVLEHVKSFSPRFAGEAPGGAVLLLGQRDEQVLGRRVVIAEAAGLLRFDRARGAVVADSDPAGEYQESLDKARALLRALGGLATGRRA